MRRLTGDEARFTQALLRGDVAPWPGLPPTEADAFLAALVEQGLAGLLNKSVGSLTTGVPDAFRHALAAEAARAAALNALRAVQARRILDAFAAAGIECAALKGVALVADGYEHLGLRPMADIDLLVSPADMAAGGSALETLGYRRAPMDSPDIAHHWAYARQGDAGTVDAVEMHRQLFADAPWDAAVPTAELLARRVAVRWESTVIPVLDLPDRLVHAAGHLVLHHPGGERLIWVADVDRLVARSAGRVGFWRHTWTRADAWGLTPALEVALAVAAQWFATPYEPRPVSGAPPSADRERSRVAAVPGAAGSGRRPGVRVWHDVAASSTWHRRAVLARGHLLPHPDDLRTWYGVRHTWQLPYYYLRRWARGLRDVAQHQVEHKAAPRRPDQWFVED